MKTFKLEYPARMVWRIAYRAARNGSGLAWLEGAETFPLAFSRLVASNTPTDNRRWIFYVKAIKLRRAAGLPTW